MKKEEFIANASIQIFAAMHSNPEKDPSLTIAVESAMDLWNELIAKGIKPEDHKMTEQEFLYAIDQIRDDLKQGK